MDKKLHYYVQLDNPDVLFDTEIRTMLDEALDFAFPLAQHLRNVDYLDGCLWCVIDAVLCCNDWVT